MGERRADPSPPAIVFQRRGDRVNPVLDDHEPTFGDTAFDRRRAQPGLAKLRPRETVELARGMLDQEVVAHTVNNPGGGSAALPSPGADRTRARRTSRIGPPVTRSGTFGETGRDGSGAIVGRVYVRAPA